MIILVILYFLIAVLATTIFTYYIGKDSGMLCYSVIISLLWPLVVPFMVFSVIFISDVRDELENRFKK